MRWGEYYCVRSVRRFGRRIGAQEMQARWGGYHSAGVAPGGLRYLKKQWSTNLCLSSFLVAPLLFACALVNDDGQRHIGE